MLDKESVRIASNIMQLRVAVLQLDAKVTFIQEKIEDVVVYVKTATGRD